MKSAHNKSMVALDQILTDSMREAAKEASIADGVMSYGSANENRNKKLELRRGKWTPEEEAYANRLIEEFKNGMLPIADGTTLRTFLSKLLNCDPMRISKKYVGNNCIGKQVYRQHHGELEDIPPEVIERSKRELEELERQFLDRSKQIGARSRSQKIGDPMMKGPRPKKDEFTSPSSSGGGSIPPWITPSAAYTYSTEASPNPYARASLEKTKNSGGYGVSDRPSEIDLYNLPDAFASTSSLDLLGTLAEMKLPSARSLENLQKYGMEGGPSTTSLSEWYSIIAENAPSFSSPSDHHHHHHHPQQQHHPHHQMNASQSSSPRNSETMNRLMPWDLKGSHDVIMKSASSHSMGSPNAPHMPAQSSGNIKHSVSRELLQAANDAVAQDEAKTELDKILKLQQERMQRAKEASTAAVAVASQPLVLATSPNAAVDARRSTSIDNFMMLVEMGDIPRPDSSVLLKNIFLDPANTKPPASLPLPSSTQESTPPQSSSSSSSSDPSNPSNKRSLTDASHSEESLQKRNRPDGTGEGGPEDDPDDGLVDAHILSAPVVRRPFT